MTRVLAWMLATNVGLFAGDAVCQVVPESGITNVLFIVVDDLRPALGCYGDAKAITPNIDRLAREGILFSRAYCQQAICSPSRTSMMLGRRPDSTGVNDLSTHFRSTVPDVVTLPQHFKQQGFYTRAFGKVYHGPALDDSLSWSRPTSYPFMSHYRTEPVLEAIRAAKESIAPGNSKPGRIFGPSWEAPDVDARQLTDGRIAFEAADSMWGLNDRPFFLAVGFMKPHLPFVAPEKYFRMHSNTRFEIAPNAFRPSGAPEYAGTRWQELRKYSDIPANGDLSVEKQRELIRGYYAATSFVDAQVGKVLAALDAEGLRESTAIVLWGDHGWHLGDHAQWTKHTNWEKAVHAPLIISAPGMKRRGIRCDALVEFVDVYPTLVDLCNLPVPEGLEGLSLVPLFEDPKRPWKTGAFSQYPRPANGVDGRSVRTERYRLTEWTDNAGQTQATELYDYELDPEENANWASDETYAPVLEELRGLLRAGWRHALPPRS